MPLIWNAEEASTAQSTLTRRDLLREKALKTLEFDKVREQLAESTSFPPSRALALTLRPSYDREEVEQLQAETRDAMRLLEARPTFALDGAKDVRPVVEAANLGGTLTGPDLFLISHTLGAVRYLQSTLQRLADSLPTLSAMGRGLGDFPEIEAAIRRTVNPSGEVMDSASDLLRRLRSEEKTAQQRLTSRLQDMAGSQLGRQVLQEPFITTRDGRYVLAVKADMRGQVQGLIHDISSSGATVFMEPLATVELGNAWRELKLAEQKEVQRILREISALIGEQAPMVLQSLDILAQVDLLLAKARLARQTRAVLPRLMASNSYGSRISLIDGHHPLLRGDVVPISVEIGKDFLSLVISGPNTGGKTVALKTLGLLALMAQAGLAVPAKEGTAMRVFDGVYADIGDEQSIQQSLSTFSSHMGNIVQLLDVMTGDSMVLLDELGAGTDPLEGAAIARAVLSSLVIRGAISVVTTHHSELKAFANANPGLQNANVEFDPVSLQPTYKLVVGLPGRSNALAIAERLGLPKDILEAAKRDIGSTEAEVDALLRKIQEERHLAESERVAAEKARQDLEQTRASLSERLQQWEEDQRKTVMVRRAEVQVLAEEVKSRLRQVGRRINSLTGEDARKEVAVLQAEMAKVKKTLEGPEFKPPTPEPVKPKEKLAPGDRILIEGLSAPGEYVSGPDKQGLIEVQLGPVRMKITQDRIKGKDKRPRPMEKRVTLSPEAAARAVVGPELWVHGMRAQQAMQALDEYMEKAALAGHARIRVIHGKGRGILRQAIHEALGDHPLVGTFRIADPDEGGEGVTIVEL